MSQRTSRVSNETHTISEVSNKYMKRRKKDRHSIATLVLWKEQLRPDSGVYITRAEQYERPGDFSFGKKERVL